MNMKTQIGLENLLWLLKSMGESELSVESEGNNKMVYGCIQCMGIS
jgi:hypothetical protein